jgi:hypothetical protein
MPGPAQRRVAAVLVSAFLEVVLGRDERYRAFLADPALGAGWLGHAALLHRYSDGRSRLLATFEEDDDLTTGSRPGVSIRGVGLARWQEREVALKRGDLDSVAVVLGWRRGDDLPTYWLTRPRDLRLDPNSVIELAVAGADGPPDAQAYARPERFSFSLVAALDDGSERVLAPALEALAPRASQTRKIARFDTLPAFEPVFQELRVPLDALDDGERAHVARIGLRFDGTPAGVILVDDIGVGVQ